MSSKTRPAPLNAPYFWDSSLWESFFGSTASSSAVAAASTQQRRTSSLASTPPSLSSSLQLSPRSSPRSPAGSLPASPPSSAAHAHASPRAVSFSFDLDNLETHVVKLDETFDSIALKHGMTAVELRRANPGVAFSSPAVPGQELRVKPVALSPPPAEPVKSRNRQPSTADVDKIGVQRDVLLCMGDDTHIAGRLVVGVQAGFLLFEPADHAVHKDFVFALDRDDIIGCCALSRVSSRMRPEAAAARVYLQVVWRNADLGFPEDKEIFFSVAQTDVAALVEALYAVQPPHGGGGSGGGKKKRTMTSGVVALRALAELKHPVSSEELLDSEDPLPIPGVPPVLQPRDSHVLTQQHTLDVAAALPERLQASSWRLLWDFDGGGVSLHALYAACRGHQETLLVISDLESDSACGVFANEAWLPAHTGFFGSGECFVFSVTRGVVNVHRWSQANDFLQSCSHDHIGVGGGGSFALCVDGDLQNATCGPSLTFVGLESRSLVRSPFRVGLMELWGFENFAPKRDSVLAATAAASGGFPVTRERRGSNLGM